MSGVQGSEWPWIGCINIMLGLLSAYGLRPSPNGAGLMAASAVSGITGNRPAEETSGRIAQMLRSGLTFPIGEALAMYYQVRERPMHAPDCAGLARPCGGGWVTSVCSPAAWEYEADGVCCTVCNSPGEGW